MNSLPADPAIRLQDVICKIGGVTIVDGLNLSVQRGEVLVLLGLSGSGKTSTLKLINHLLMPSSGSVEVEGKSTSQWDPIALRRHMGYVIQEGGLFPHFTVRENVGLVPRLESWAAGRTAARVDEVLQLVGLDPGQYAGRYPRELSGGQRQRVGVARALALDPPFLLMDEPFGALDPLTRAALQKEFRELQARMGKTVIFVTHDILEALLLADRIALLESGKLVLAAPPKQFLKSNHPSVQAFLQPVQAVLSSIQV